MRKITVMLGLLICFLLTFSLFPYDVNSEVPVDSDHATSHHGHSILSTVLYKDMGEQDPSNDYFAVKATVSDEWTKNDFYSGPLFIQVYLYFPSYARETPTNHKPESGWVWSNASWSLSYEGIGLSGKSPLYGISYGAGTYKQWYRVHWSLYGTVTDPPSTLARWFVTGDYADFGVGVRVPQGSECYCFAEAWVVYHQFVSYSGSFNVKDIEWASWCFVTSGSSHSVPGQQTVPFYIDKLDVMGRKTHPVTRKTRYCRN